MTLRIRLMLRWAPFAFPSAILHYVRATAENRDLLCAAARLVPFRRNAGVRRVVFPDDRGTVVGCRGWADNRCMQAPQQDALTLRVDIYSLLVCQGIVK